MHKEGDSDIIHKYSVETRHKYTTVYFAGLLTFAAIRNWSSVILIRPLMFQLVASINPVWLCVVRIDATFVWGKEASRYLF